MTTIFSNTTSVSVNPLITTSVATSSETSLTTDILFWILLTLGIPSLACVLLLLGCLCFDRTLRHALHNHVIIVLLVALLFSQLIDLRNYVTHLKLKYVWPPTAANCYAWWFATYGIYNGLSMLMAWAAIERHILVFHYQWLNTCGKRLLIHYTPLALIVLYVFIFYGSFLFLVPCENRFRYASMVCGAPCYFSVGNIAWYDTIVNTFLPTMLALIANTSLFIRVVHQKQKLRQQVQWHKYQRMIIQLLSCSALFLLFYLPPMSLIFAQQLGLPSGALGQFESWVWFMGYFIVVLMPFVCLAASKDVCTKIKQAMIGASRKRNEVVPTTARTRSRK